MVVPKYHQNPPLNKYDSGSKIYPVGFKLFFSSTWSSTLFTSIYMQSGNQHSNWNPSIFRDGVCGEFPMQQSAIERLMPARVMHTARQLRLAGQHNGPGQALALIAIATRPARRALSRSHPVQTHGEELADVAQWRKGECATAGCGHASGQLNFSSPNWIQ